MITMTPQARAIAVFTLATLLITGHLNRLALAVFAATGGDVPGGRSQQFVMSLLTVLLAGAVLWFAHQTVIIETPNLRAMPVSVSPERTL